MPARGALLPLALAAHVAAKTISGDWIAVDVGSKTCRVTDYDSACAPNGAADCTHAFQRALDDCSGGGEVLIPAPGTYLTFGVSTKTSVGLGINVERGARWLFNNDTAAWKSQPGQCIMLMGADGVALYGGGVIDGNGAAWWPTPDAYRPGLLMVNGQQLLITNLTFQDSPNHQLQLYADHAEVVDTHVLAPESPASHNTDGADVHASFHWYHRLNITTGDDNIAFHANHTLVNDNYFGTGHGTSIGSLGVGTFLFNITVRDCMFDGTTQALRIKADCGSTGSLSGVTFGPNISMTNVGQSILVTAFYPSNGPGPCSGGRPSTLAVHNVTFTGITSRNAGQAGDLWCDKGTPCTGITFQDVVHTPSPKHGWSCQAFKGTAGHVTPALPAGCLGA